MCDFARNLSLVHQLAGPRSWMVKSKKYDTSFCFAICLYRFRAWLMSILIYCSYDKIFVFD